jgi:hypothetical protein
VFSSAGLNKEVLPVNRPGPRELVPPVDLAHGCGRPSRTMIA